MGIYRRNVKIQLALFIAFIFLAVNNILNYVLTPIFSWYSIVVLVISLAFIGFVVYLYRKTDNSIITITQKEYKEIRYTLYAYFIVYIADILIESVESLDKLLLAIVSSIVLGLIATFGVILNLRLLNKA